MLTNPTKKLTSRSKVREMDFVSEILKAPQAELWLFYILSAIAFPLAIGVILDKVIIRSGFLLIGVFGTISGFFLLLQAQFLALAQIMIYAVGITLVVVIALMLTNPRLEADTTITRKGSSWGAAIVALLAFVTIYASVRSEHWPISDETMNPNNVAQLGEALTTTYSIPFEFASVLLLAALMGAIMLAKAEPATKTKESEEQERQLTGAAR